MSSLKEKFEVLDVSKQADSIVRCTLSLYRTMFLLPKFLGVRLARLEEREDSIFSQNVINKI